MRSLAFYVAGGLAVVLAVDFLMPRAGAYPDLLGRVGRQATVPANTVDRTLKGDRLAPLRAAASVPRTIATVEIVGLRNTAVVYRDHAGRELFRTDPLTNATVVAKGVVLPEVTIRESGGSAVDPVPVDAPRPPAPDHKPPLGCEPPISPLAGRVPPNVLGRCIVENANPAESKIAAVSAGSLRQSN